ncbi:MAG TPA: energy transducer TonB [Gemmatimonadaceae bacterium]|nr:energy transducer TonB [Gemmatimonadaceae bacterium]
MSSEIRDSRFEIRNGECDAHRVCRSESRISNLESRLLLLLFAAFATACPMVQRWYVPKAGEETMSLDDLRQAADLALRKECPRLLNGGTTATGEALITVEVDANGVVHRARVDQSSGDRAVDDLFGTLATRMRLQPATAAESPTAQGAVAIGYSCAPNTAIATIRLNP